MMEYTFLWYIQNYSHCWHKNGEELISPTFIAKEMKGTAWFLEFYPRGRSKDDKGSISVSIMREYDDGPETISLGFELSIFDEDGSTLCSHEKSEASVIRKGYGYSVPSFVDIDEVLERSKSEYLPEDTLNVRCKIWWGKGKIQRIGETCARTCIAVKKISFLHLVEGFSSLKPNHSSTVKIGYHTTEECLISSNLYCIGDSCSEENIMFEITSSGIKFLSKCLVFFLDGFGLKIPCGQVYNQIHRSVKLPLSLTRKAIMNGKTKYLTDDKLSLKCELIFSTGLEFETIEEVSYEIPAMAYAIPLEFKNDYEDLPECSGAIDDLKAIYSNQFLTDVELKTSTASFPAHKIILCARSPVFTAMLSNNMREKNSNCIKIEDLEDHILKRLLLFLYSDNLEDLQWKTATKLYYAADKYEVKKLKAICSNFLEGNLDTSNASELLLLADTHCDSYLKKIAEDFIFGHDAEVFSSDEWEDFIETNPQLALKTMHLKYKRKKEVN
ncbi:Speckle-type POZ protein [Araneus ventricosus]|uniref:Speckle-type POZ protein n=1 Tax=Araneus ventricosus TaxID=182803 RepID=A0A4Y2Q7B2_ARAVE|nr:Speckle-type POZ protein [Araneus ventricosus]